MHEGERRLLKTFSMRFLKNQSYLRQFQFILLLKVQLDDKLCGFGEIQFACIWHFQRTNLGVTTRSQGLWANPISLS